jgi:glucokinase-like ROK family protein
VVTLTDLAAMRPPEGGSNGSHPVPRARRTGPADHSLADVLGAIRVGGARSRADVMQASGVRRAVAAQRIAELIGEGLLVEGGTAPSTGGRPPRQLEFHSAAGLLLVADLGATSIDVAVTDLGGSILAHRGEPSDIADGPESILGRVEQLFDEVLEAAGGPGRPVWGIGIGVPGPVEFESGLPVSPPIMPGWDGYPIRRRMTERYGVPVWVDNDVNLMALGEWRHGLARGHANVIYVKVGTGIGAGLISDGTLHRGAQGAAGDIGHIQVTADPGVLCRCGNIGCLEAVAGGAALAREGERAAREGRSGWLSGVLQARGLVSAREVGEGAGRGDAACVELLQRAGSDLGNTIAALVNFFNPSLIVIGGGVSRSGDSLLAAVREIVYRRSLPLATRDLVIKRTALGEVGGVIGAATMVADQLFSREALPAWIGGVPHVVLQAVAGG